MKRSKQTDYLALNLLDTTADGLPHSCSVSPACSPTHALRRAPNEGGRASSHLDGMVPGKYRNLPGLCRSYPGNLPVSRCRTMSLKPAREP